MAGGFVAYYSVNALFASHLQKDMHFTPAMVATPIFFANIGVFVASCFWGFAADRIGRRWSMIIPGLVGIFISPLYLFTDNMLLITVGFTLQGCCAGGGMQGLFAAYLNERFPTEVRASSGAFCYHQASFIGGFVPLVLTYMATHFDIGLAGAMMAGTAFGAINFVLALLVGPETKGKVLVPDLVVA
jgi:MFS transporter, SHS family, lactate transporter